MPQQGALVEMFIRPRLAFAIIWIAWLASWLAAALWARRTEKRVISFGTLFYRIVILAGAALLTPWAARKLDATPLWRVGFAGACALAGLTLAGLLLAWWARIYLGPLWSGSITRKEGHRVVDTGPYAFVRHPIYTGLIVAIAASALAEATWASLLGAALVAFGLWLKARIEERFLTTEVGADAYGAYRRRVPMLLPFPMIRRRQ